MEPLEGELDLKMNFCNADDHVPEAERNNQSLEGRFRVQFYRLPFKKITRLMIRHLAMHVARTFNWLPVKGGVSKYYSPHMIINRRSLEWKRDFQKEFGSYVKPHKTYNPKNNNKPRALNGIYLGPVQDNDQGGSMIIDLSTGREITRSQVDEVVMTELVIKQVERMAEKQGFGDSLKFIGSKRRILVPDPDLSGVDMEFQLEEFNDENYRPVEEEDEDLIVEEHITEEEIEDLREDELQDPGPETVDENEYQENNNEEEEIVEAENIL